MGRGQQEDAFKPVMGTRRGIGKKGEDRELAVALEKVRQHYLQAGTATADNDFQDALTILLKHREDPQGNEGVREIYDRVVAEAPRMLAECARGLREDDLAAHKDGLPLLRFARIAGLESQEVQTGRADALLDDPRLKEALQGALDSALGSRVSTVKGLAKKMCEAWRETLSELVLESVWADDMSLWRALRQVKNGIRDIALPKGTPALTDVLIREEVKALLWRERPIVDFTAVKSRGFSVRENFRERDHFHNDLWPLAYAGLAKTLFVRENQTRDLGVSP